jgi:hypothetical protein
LSFIIGVVSVGSLGFWAYLVLQSAFDSSPFDPYVDILGLALVLLLSAGVFHILYEDVPEK